MAEDECLKTMAALSMEMARRGMLVGVHSCSPLCICKHRLALIMLADAMELLSRSQPGPSPDDVSRDGMLEDWTGTKS